MTIKQILEFKFVEINDFSLTVSSLLSIVVIVAIARILVYLLKQLLKRSGAKSSVLDSGKQNSILQLFKYFVYVIAAILSFQTLGFNISILLASSAALFVGIGLGLQHIFTDIVSGIFLLFERTIEVGDMIEVDGLVGRVKEISIRTSKVRTRNDIMIIVPNSKFITGNVINWSSENRSTRFVVSVGVAYGSDTQKVKDILLTVAQQHNLVAVDPAPFVRFVNFGNSSLDFELLFWTEHTWVVETIKSDLRFNIDQQFRENKVSIPFPQQDIYIKQLPGK